MIEIHRAIGHRSSRMVSGRADRPSSMMCDGRCFDIDGRSSMVFDLRSPIVDCR